MSDESKNYAIMIPVPQTKLTAPAVWRELNGRRYGLTMGRKSICQFHTMGCPARLCNASVEGMPFLKLFESLASTIEMARALLALALEKPERATKTWRMVEVFPEPSLSDTVSLMELISYGGLMIDGRFAMTIDVNGLKETMAEIERQSGDSRVFEQSRALVRRRLTRLVFGADY